MSGQGGGGGASAWGAVAQAASSIGGQLIANAGNARQNRKNRQHARQMMDIQHLHQRDLNEQGRQIQLQMWKDTNYPAQMEQMKLAGLNPSLMYGQSGGGGTTTGSQGGGSAAAGQTPSNIPMMPLDLGAALQSAAQVKLMNAQAKKAEAEADSLRGKEGTIGASQIEKLIAETANEQQKNKLLQIDEQMKKIDSLWHSDKLYNEVNKLAMEMHLLQGETWIQENSKQAIVDEIKAKATGQGIVNELNTERIRLTQAQEEQVRAAVTQKWNEIDLHDTEVNIKIAQTIINGISQIGGVLQAGKLAEAMKKGKQATEKAWGEGFKEGVDQMKN